MTALFVYLLAQDHMYVVSTLRKWLFCCCCLFVYKFVYLLGVLSSACLKTAANKVDVFIFLTQLQEKVFELCR